MGNTRALRTDSSQHTDLIWKSCRLNKQTWQCHIAVPTVQTAGDLDGRSIITTCWAGCGGWHMWN